MKEPTPKLKRWEVRLSMTYETMVHVHARTEEEARQVALEENGDILREQGADMLHAPYLIPDIEDVTESDEEED